MWRIYIWNVRVFFKYDFLGLLLFRLLIIKGSVTHICLSGYVEHEICFNTFFGVNNLFIFQTITFTVKLFHVGSFPPHSS